MLKLFDPRWLALVMLLTVAALPVRTHASTPTVVFSEIAWAGSSSSASDEWIELTNVSDAVVDLSGWTLTGAGSSGADLVLPDSAQIQPHSTFVIANYEHTHANSALESAPHFVTSTVSLPNNGFSLSIYDAGNALVDVAGGSGAPFAGGSGGTGDSIDGRYQSMVRADGLGDGSVAQSWADADTSSGFKVDIQDLGTPGSVVFATRTVETEPAEETPVEEELLLADAESLADGQYDTDMTEVVIDEATPAIIRISEFVVDPNEDESEWIELVNPGTESVDLTGWILEDATGKQTILEGILETGDYLVVDSPLGKLNNDADSIILKNSAGVLIDSVEYGTDELAAPKDGAALALGTSGLFELTYATSPGEMNVIDPEKPDAEEAEKIEEVDPGFSLGESEETGEVVVDEDELFDPSVTSVPSDLSVSPDEDESATEEPATNIRISEFVIDPSGDGVEWIELFNAGDMNATLEGWTIEDASGKTTDLSGVTIEADSYVVIESPKGKLNNDADSVILKDASGATIESVVYGGDGYSAPKDGDALARNGETFEITQQPTPGSANLIFVALEEIVEEEVEESQSEESTELVNPSVDQGLLPADAEALAGGQDDNGTEKIVIVKTLRFVALYPNANGSDEEEEYIVIENTGSEAIDLMGWSIEDGSTDSYEFEYSVVVQAGATFTLGRPESKLTLNNGGDTLELIAPDGEVAHLVTYGNSAKGATYDLVNETWAWTATVAESVVTESTMAESTTTSTPVTSSTTTASNSTIAPYVSTTASSLVIQSLTIAQAKAKADGQSVIVKGVVTSTPGTFGSQIFYLQDETGGIQVYLYSGDFPELVEGDVVQVTGELSTSRGERRVKLASASGAVSASGTFTSQLVELAMSEVDESLVGLLMKIQGQIQSIDTSKLVLEQAGATLTIYLKSNPAIDAQQFERGDKIEVTGVLTSYDDELRLRPRSDIDITVVEEAVVASAVATKSSAGLSAGMMLLITTMAALVALALWRYLPRRRLTPAAA